MDFAGHSLHEDMHGYIYASSSRQLTREENKARTYSGADDRVRHPLNWTILLTASEEKDIVLDGSITISVKGWVYYTRTTETMRMIRGEL